MRSHCVSLGLKSSDCCPSKRIMRSYRQRKEHHLKAAAEVGVMQLQARDAREWDPSPGARRKQRWIPPTTNYLALATQFVVLCYGTPAN